MEESYNVIKYQLAYATKSGARCRIAKCTLPIMAKGEFRIGTVSLEYASWNFSQFKNVNMHYVISISR